MRRKYICPKMEVTNIETEFIIAASTTAEESPSNSDAGMSNERRGSWGDLWINPPRNNLPCQTERSSLLYFI